MIMGYKKVNIVHLGISGFPYGLAPIQKSLLIYKGLVKAGASVTVVNRKARHDPGLHLELSKEGVFEGIHYVYTAGTPYRAKTFLRRNFLKMKGLINEIRLLIRLHHEKKLDVGMIYTTHFADVLYYRIFSKLLKFPVILNYVEFRSAIRARNRKTLTKINDYLFDRLSFSLVDGVLPISDFLIGVVKKNSPEKPLLKVPVLCDFDKFKNIKRKAQERYFLFCGTAAYIEIIIFILGSFDLLSDVDPPVYLYLVVNGSANQLLLIDSEIHKIKKSKFVRKFSDLPYDELINLYVNAIGLLIPMRPTIQDTARFPHKIGEYAASGCPIITTNFGEIKNYFIDQRTALIAERYDIREFAEKMEFVICNPEKAREIGSCGRSMGIDNFDYERVGKKIKAFILSLLSRKSPVHRVQ